MEPEKLIETLAVAERLKDATRHCYTSRGRRESVAEHSWRITLMAYLVSDEFPEANLEKLMKMCLIHDLGEAFTGDIPTFEKSEKDEEKEQMPEIKEEDVPNINYDDFKPIISFDNVSEDEIIDTALNRLAQDTYFGINGLPLIACFLHIYNRAKTDINFSKQVLIKSKNFSKAFDYLTKQVKSMSVGNGIGLDHRQIFAILDDYYDLDDAVIAEKEAEAKAKVKAKSKAKKTNEGTTKKVTKNGSTKKSAAKPDKKVEKEEEKPLDLFSLLGGSN